MTHPRFDYATSELPYINKARFIGHHLIQRKAKSIYWASKQTKWPFLVLMMMILMMWSCIFFHKNVMFSWERASKPAAKDPSVCFLVRLLGHCYWKLTDGPTEQNLQSSWVTVCRCSQPQCFNTCKTVWFVLCCTGTNSYYRGAGRVLDGN